MKNFFHRIHLKFVQWFATFFLRHANKSIRRLLVLNRAYQDLSYLVVPLLSLTNDVVREQVINVGKNPDEIVALPKTKSSVVPFTANDRINWENEGKAWEQSIPPGQNPHWIVDAKSRPNIWDVSGGNYVHDPKQHPVLKTRDAWYAKQHPEVMHVNVASGPQATEAATTEVGTETINELRDAFRDTESTLHPAVADDKKSE